jgi:hypothetical protein
MLGQKVSAVFEGTLQVGEQLIKIETDALQSGIYFVKFSTDNNLVRTTTLLQRDLSSIIKPQT